MDLKKPDMVCEKHVINCNHRLEDHIIDRRKGVLYPRKIILNCNKCARYCKKYFFNPGKAVIFIASVRRKEMCLR